MGSIGGTQVQEEGRCGADLDEWIFRHGWKRDEAEYEGRKGRMHATGLTWMGAGGTRARDGE